MKNLKIDKSWTLFLDRDGVINNKLEDDYVKKWEEFSFTNNAVESISKLSEIFYKIIIVTNQRGIAKGIMSENELTVIHKKMVDEIVRKKGRIDKIYFCPDLSNDSDCRKPNPGMALKAKLEFPEIDFRKSFIVGDSISDMLFGKKLGMKCAFISENSNEEFLPNEHNDFQFKSLFEFANKIILCHD